MNEIKKSTVAVMPCENYDDEKVYKAVRLGIEAVGGIGAFVSADEKILVKPNFLYASEPAKCITTHPAVIRAVLRVLSENGYGNVKYGDSPAAGSCKAAAAALGLTGDNTYGAELAQMSDEVTVKFPEGSAAKEFHFTRDVVEADAIIGVCKMKTHMLERVTGAVKNMYGLVCGFRKAAGHVSYPNAAVFAEMMADMHSLVKPRLHIMDAITAMEGNGPSGGEPRDMGLILVSSDPVAIDSAFCSLVHLDPLLVPTNVYAMRANIGTYEEDKIDVLLADGDSDSFETVTLSELALRFGNPDFDVRRGKERFSILGVWSRITSPFSRRPVIDASKCKKCGICVSHCPLNGKALSFKKGKDHPPVYNYTECIRCYCCQELCPEKAIKVR